MAVNDLVRYRNPSAATFAAQRAPATPAQLRSSSYNHAMSNLRWNSEREMTSLAMDEMIAPLYGKIEQETGESNLYGKARAAGYKYTQARTGGPPVAFSYEEGVYMALQEDLTKRGIEVPSWDDVKANAQARADVDKARYEDDMIYNVSSSPMMDTVLGAFGGVVQDPLILSTIAVSSVFGVGTFWSAMAAETALGIVAEVPIQLSVQEWHQQRGHEYTNTEVAKGIVANVLLAGGVAGLTAKALRGVGLEAPLFEGPAADIERLLAATSKPSPTPQNIYDGQPLYSVETTYMADGVLDTPYGQQATPLKDIYGMAAQAAPPTRSDLYIIGRDLHLHQTNPVLAARYLNKSGLDMDEYVQNPLKIEQLHHANIAQATEALYSRGTIAPVNRNTLSLELFEYQPDAVALKRAYAVADMDLPFDPMNRGYRAFVVDLFRQAVEPKLLAKIENAPAVEPPAVKRPGTPLDKLRERKGKVLAEINDAKRQFRRVENAMKAKMRELERGPDPDPEILEPMYRAGREQKQRHEANMEKLDKAYSDVQERINNYNAYDAYLVARAKWKGAAEARAQLEQLQNGRVPKKLKADYDKFDEATRSFETVATKVDAPEVKLSDVMRGYDMFPFLQTPASRKKYLETAEREARIAADAQQAEAIQAEFERMPPQTRFELDGREMTREDLEFQHKQENDALVAMRDQCNKPAAAGAEAAE